MTFDETPHFSGAPWAPEPPISKLGTATLVLLVAFGMTLLGSGWGPADPATGSGPAAQGTTETAANSAGPLQVHVPEAEMQTLRPRVAAARWPDRATVPDRQRTNADPDGRRRA